MATNINMPAKMGRPTTYNRDIADEACQRMSEGESLSAICRDDHMPGASTIRTWAVRDEDGLYARYARAREMQADSWFDEALEIADNGGSDFIEGEDGKVLVNHENIQRSRLRVDTRKWAASKMCPKVYGDHASRTLTVEPGEGYVALLEALDDRRMVDVTPTISSSDSTE